MVFKYWHREDTYRFVVQNNTNGELRHHGETLTFDPEIQVAFSDHADLK